MKNIFKLTFCSVLFYSTIGYAKRYNSIEVFGADKLGKSSVLHYSKLKSSVDINRNDIKQAVISLYKSGLYSNVSISEYKQTLYVKVTEFPVISKLEFTGTDHLPKDKLFKALRDQGLDVGQVYKPKVIFQLKPMLKQTLASMGYEQAFVDVRVKQKKNTVSIILNVDEGKNYKVSDISFIGAKAVSERLLLSKMNLAPRIWSFISDNNKYSEIALNNDLMNIEEYYKNLGYLMVKVKLLKKTRLDGNIKLVIGIDEGKVFRLNKVNLKGFVGQDFGKIISTLEKGSAYSLRDIKLVSKELEHKLGAKGYPFAKVLFKPALVSKDLVNILYVANLGPKLKVGHINFLGQSYTQDEVLRREMRQLERSQYNYMLVRESERRLRNLSFIKSASCMPTRKGGFVDLNCQIKELPSASIVASIGYSAQAGMTYKLDLNQKNFAGSGNKLNISAEKSDAQTSAQLSISQPYIFGTDYTNTWSLDFVNMRNLQKDSAKYKTNHFSLMNDFSVPLSDFTSLGFGLGLQNVRILDYDKNINHIDSFINAHGKHFTELDAHFTLFHSSLDKTPFPTMGRKSKLHFMVTLPYHDPTVRYYKVDFSNSYYFKLPKNFVFNWMTQLGYGKGYNGDSYPFFKNYWAGGEGSVRGFKNGSLGPLDNNGNPRGGNVLASTSFNLYLPQMINENMRYGFFVDAGNVFDNSINVHDMRVSYGAMMQWLTPIAPISFSFGYPLVKKTGDSLESFAVSMATDL